jgi:hypothetical protein
MIILQSATGRTLASVQRISLQTWINRWEICQSLWSLSASKECLSPIASSRAVYYNQDLFKNSPASIYAMKNATLLASPKLIIWT